MASPLRIVLGAIALLAIVTPAPATAVEFHSETSPTTITGIGTENTVFTTNAGTVSCKQSSFTGTWSSATVSEWAAAPAYSECTAFGFVGSTIHMNGCWYALKTWGFDIICPAGKAITVTAFNCWITYPTQFGVGAPIWTWGGAGILRKIIGHFALKAIKYVQHSKSFPGCSSGEFTNGTLSYRAEFKGQSGGGSSVGIWVE